MTCGGEGECKLGWGVGGSPTGYGEIFKSPHSPQYHLA